jgi:ribosomal protein L11 methyltransferase
MSRAIPVEAAASWRIALTVPLEAAAVAENALSDFSTATARFEAEDGRLWSVYGYAPREPDRQALAVRLALVGALAGTGDLVPVVERVPATDWLAATHHAFPPLRIGRFFIHGSHVRGRTPPGTVPLKIDAATAFGTGEHPTTEGCLRALGDLARAHRPRAVLDMGCGTGILGMAAARLFPGPVLAVDSDAESVRVAAINARLNGLARRLDVVLGDGYRSPAVTSAAPFDLVLANILARPLMLMAPALAGHLAAGGIAILSGLLDRQEAAVLAAHRTQGLALVRRYPIRGWPTLVLHRSKQ